VAKPERKLSRVKALPWAGLLQAGMVLARRWQALSEKDRARLTRLVRDRLHVRRGRTGRLSVKERHELRRLVGKLDVKGARNELVALLGAGRRRRRKRR
jgi:hypothetical protein